MQRNNGGAAATSGAARVGASSVRRTGATATTSRTPASAANATMSTASTAKEETFVLRATPSIKRFNIARFDTPQLPQFKQCAQPVLMYREPERVIEDDDDNKEDEVVGYNPALRKRRRRRRKDTRTAGWVIDDAASTTTFHGVCEGGQTSTYMLLVKNRHNDEFSVVPIEQWFRFKKPLSYRTLTLDEAEDLNNEKKRAVERWLMKHKLAGDDRSDAGDTVSAPRVRTGALSRKSTSGGSKAVDADDPFAVAESRPKQRVVRAKATGENDAQGDDGGDFDEKFDDDESDAEIEHEDAKVVASDSDDDDDAAGDNGVNSDKLTATGQAMHDLLARAQSGDMLAGNSMKDDKAGTAGLSDPDDDDDDDYSAKDMDKIKRDLGGNIIRDGSVSASTTAKAVGVGGSASNANSASDALGSASDATGPNKSSGSSGSSNATSVVNGSQDGTGSSSATGTKRKADDSSNAKRTDESTNKAAKTAGGATASSAASAASSSNNRLSEAGVQQELVRYGGRMRTRDLLKKLKKLLVTDNDRALLKDILRTICDVEVDAIDGRLLVLKSQFR